MSLLTSSHSRSSGKSLPLVLAAAAIVAVALLYFGGVFGGASYDADDGSGGGDIDLLGADGDSETEQETKKESASLGGLYGDGDYGAIRMRLLWVGGSGKPVMGQAVRLLARNGEELASVPSDQDGVVLFGEVRPAKGYHLHIQGEGFSPVELRGITVFNESTKDLGDLILGKDIVLRGRVVDAAGRPVPGTAVSVHTIERAMATKGMLFTMAEQAANMPFALTAVKSDDDGNFAFGGIEDGQYSLVARHAGYASKHDGEVIVASERGAGVLTLVLGEAGRLYGEVRDPDGKPIAGAQVVAIRDTGWRGRMNTLEREVTLTDEDGTYVIDTVAAGSSYRLGVVAKGFAPVYTTQAVAIEQGDTEKDFTLVEGGNLEGVVTDEQTGKPIANAKIAVFVGAMGFGRGGGGNPDDKSVADTRTTDDEGRFRFESIPPGPVSSSVVRASGYASVITSQWTGNLWPPIEAAQTTEVNVTLKRGGTIRGYVRVGETKQPLQGAQVSVMQTGWAAMGAIWSGAPTSITTADGAYEIQGVLPGKYRLHTLADGYSSDGGQDGVEVEIPAAGGAVAKDLSMSTAGVVTGVVLDPAGDPISGVRIRVKAGREANAEGEGNRRRQRGGNMARQMLASGRSPVDLSDDEGAFRLEGVAADAMWIVYGESDEYVSGETKSFKIAAGEEKTVKFTMTPGGALRGRVVDENGRALAGARVQVGHLTEDMLKRKNLSSWEASRALGQEAYLTDDGGRFLATNLEPGPAIVRASKEGYVTFFKRNATINTGEVYDGYSIALSKGEVVEGRVLGSEGQPLARAMVAVTKQANPGGRGDEGENPDEETSEEVEPMMFARTDEQGKYRIEDVKPGVYSVVVWMAGGHKGWARSRDEEAIHREVAVPAGTQDFKLQKADPRPTGGNQPGGGNR